MSRVVANNPRKKISNQVDVATSIVETGQKVYGTAKEYWRRNFAYTITVSEKDPLYAEVFDWLVSTRPGDKHRAITVSSSRINNEVSDSPDREVLKKLIIRFDEGTSKQIQIDGHNVRIHVIKPEINKDTFQTEPMKIEFVMNSHAAQKAVLKFLEELNSRRSTTRKPVLRMVGTWRNWTTRSDLPPRTMASVALPADQKERIVKDLGEFLEAEDQYNRLAIPWHRGYMFHGPPGTGKTSLAKALANEFNLDLWYISLSDLNAEASLISLLADVGPRSLLLLEDIDTLKITHDRDESEQGKISMGSLLNTLDGVATPHGLIAVMTTNRFDVLDTALTRAGRMDLIEHLDFPSENTLAAMYRHFYDKAPSWGRREGKDEPLVGLSTSQVAETMKRHMKDPKGASAAVLKMINSTLKGETNV